MRYQIIQEGSSFTVGREKKKSEILNGIHIINPKNLNNYFDNYIL